MLKKCQQWQKRDAKNKIKAEFVVINNEDSWWRVEKLFLLSRMAGIIEQIKHQLAVKTRSLLNYKEQEQKISFNIKSVVQCLQSMKGKQQNMKLDRKVLQEN